MWGRTIPWWLFLDSTYWCCIKCDTHIGDRLDINFLLMKGHLKIRFPSVSVMGCDWHWSSFFRDVYSRKQDTVRNALDSRASFHNYTTSYQHQHRRSKTWATFIATSIQTLARDITSLLSHIIPFQCQTPEKVILMGWEHGDPKSSSKYQKYLFVW